MNRFTFLFPVLLWVLLVSPFEKSFTTLWIIDVQNYSFSPDNIPNVELGDTVRWVWVSGFHTTTASDFPDGAVSWDAPINIEFPSFDYVPEMAGTYNYVCTPHASMGMDGSFTVMAAQGFEDHILASEIMVFPNPFSQNIDVRFSDNIRDQIKEIAILDPIGKLLYRNEINLLEAKESVVLQLNALPVGYYFLYARDYSNRIYGKKILKK